MSKTLAIPHPIEITDNQIKQLKDELSHYDVAVKYYADEPTSEEQIIERIKDANYLMIAVLHLNADILSYAKNLEYISITFTGYDHVDIEYCKAHNIKVSNAAGYSTTAVAELTIAMAIMLFRQIISQYLSLKAAGDRINLPGRELYGKTWGVIGYGNIGKKVVEYAKYLGCNVIVYTRSAHANEKDVTFVTKEYLLKNSDIISLHIPLNTETRHFISYKEFSLMKKDAILINTARALIVDQDAMKDALLNKTISAVATDVLENDPPIDPQYPLLHIDNLFALPHIGYYTSEALERRADIGIRNLINYLNGNVTNEVC
ncbi:MAG TPA: NAD(P)-dependent oxidoreductase [Bacteroidales bacterium]|nr:NAD(P)-dependent oxidoreductase [Bacteroidales bacterium]